MSPFPYSCYAVLVAYDTQRWKFDFLLVLRNVWIIQQIFIFVRIVYITLDILSEYHSYYRITIHESLSDYQKPISYYDHFSI